VEVILNGDVDENMPWSFVPTTKVLKVRVGEPVLAFYTVTNNSDKPIVFTLYLVVHSILRLVSQPTMLFQTKLDNIFIKSNAFVLMSRRFMQEKQLICQFSSTSIQMYSLFSLISYLFHSLKTITI